MPLEKGQAVRIRLNRPQALNSFNGALHDALVAALKAAAGDAGVRCVVITGAGKPIVLVAVDWINIDGRTRDEWHALLAKAAA